MTHAPPRPHKPWTKESELEIQRYAVSHARMMLVDKAHLTVEGILIERANLARALKRIEELEQETL